MKINTVDHTTKVLAVAISALIILCPFVFSVGSFALSQGAQNSQPFLEKPAAKYEKCVRETTYMRFHHMELLKRLREEAVREGKVSEVGLESCCQCHTSRERFCDSCHNAVNLHPDCFGCHYYPKSAAGTEN
jgi:hypothetical protein